MGISHSNAGSKFQLYHLGSSFLSMCLSKGQKAAAGDRHAWTPANHAGDPDGTSDSGILPGPAMVIMVIWDVDQQMENLMLIPSLLFRLSKTLKLISTERSLTPDTHLQNVWTSLLHKHPMSHFYLVDPSLKDSYEKRTQRSSHFSKVYILFPWTVRLGFTGHLNKWKVPRNVKMKSYFPSILNTKFTIFQSDVW